MATLDLSGVSYFMPIFGFLLVFTIMYALLAKLKLLGDNKFVNILISLIIAVIFSTMSSAQEYIQLVTPWFAVLMIAMLFIFLIIGMGPHKYEAMLGQGFFWFLIVILIAIFLTSAIVVFPSIFGEGWNTLTDFVTNESRIVGGIILALVAAAAAWVIAKK